MSGFERCKYNPIELMRKFWVDPPLDHITYDPKLFKGDYYIIRQGGGDGTLIFTYNMIMNTLKNIVCQTSYSKSNVPDPSRDHIGTKYIIGPLRYSVVYGQVWLKCSKTHKYPGMKDRARIAVKIQEYIYQTN